MHCVESDSSFSSFAHPLHYRHLADRRVTIAGSSPLDLSATASPYQSQHRGHQQGTPAYVAMSHSAEYLPAVPPTMTDSHYDGDAASFGYQWDDVGPASVGHSQPSVFTHLQPPGAVCSTSSSGGGSANAGRKKRKRGGSGGYQRGEKDIFVKRMVANTQERTRMRRLNDALDALRRVIPPHFHLYHHRLSKIKTLRLAISYIAALGDALGCDGEEGARVLGEHSRQWTAAQDRAYPEDDDEDEDDDGGDRNYNTFSLDALLDASSSPDTGSGVSRSHYGVVGREATGKEDAHNGDAVVCTATAELRRPLPYPATSSPLMHHYQPTPASLMNSPATYQPSTRREDVSEHLRHPTCMAPFSTTAAAAEQSPSLVPSPCPVQKPSYETPPMSNAFYPRGARPQCSRLLADLISPSPSDGLDRTPSTPQHTRRNTRAYDTDDSLEDQTYAVL